MGPHMVLNRPDLKALIRDKEQDSVNIHSTYFKINCLQNFNLVSTRRAVHGTHTSVFLKIRGRKYRSLTGYKHQLKRVYLSSSTGGREPPWTCYVNQPIMNSYNANNSHLVKFSLTLVFMACLQIQKYTSADQFGIAC